MHTLLSRQIEQCRLEGGEINYSKLFDLIGDAYSADERGKARSDRAMMLMSEEMEEAVELAQTANQSKSQFLANMSHELRTPLSSIIGHSEILIEDLELSGFPDMVVDARKVHRAAQHLLSLINEVLDLSKIEAGRMEVSVVPLSLDDLVYETLAIAESLALVNKNQLIIRVQSLGAAKGDDTKIRQCLLNLLSNACKFTENGKIYFEACRVRNQLQFVVEDTGIGMTEVHLNRLFQPFVQADNTTTRKFGGTGLGLMITRELARLMGGDVLVSSQAGIGSKFTLTLNVEA